MSSEEERLPRIKGERPSAPKPYPICGDPFCEPCRSATAALLRGDVGRSAPRKRRRGATS